MKPPTVFLGEMTNPEVEAFLQSHHTVIVPTGATEQHGPHGPLLTDVLIPQEVARRVAPAAELVFSEGKVSGKLALQVIVGPTATERAPYPACPLAKRGADLLRRHAGSSKSVCMTDTI